MDYTIKLPVSEDYKSNEGLLYVEIESEESHKEALEQMATYFKREFKFDWNQYSKNEHDTGCIGFLFVERAMDKIEHTHHHPHRVIGGGCFRDQNNQTFKLDWVWLHPFARNRKNLKKHWNSFKEKFGNFTYSTPISPQMAKFIEKHGHLDK